MWDIRTYNGPAVVKRDEASNVKQTVWSVFVCSYGGLFAEMAFNVP